MIVDARWHPSAVASAPAGEVDDGPEHGRRLSPATIEEDRGERGPRRTVAASLPSETGGPGLSFQACRPSHPPLPRDLTFRWCVLCNRRGAAHIDDVCTMAHAHEVVR